MVRVGLVLFGLGNVARAFLRLLIQKRDEMQRQWGMVEVVGVATRRLGRRIVPHGLPLEALLFAAERSGSRMLAGFPEAASLEAFLARSLEGVSTGVALELASLNPQTGQPGIEHLAAALTAGAHVVSANKGPVLHGYEELSALARRQQRQFLFEATCLAGAPFFSLFRETRPLCRLVEFRGIVNVTANLVLKAMEGGLSFEDGVKLTQSLGLAETDPSHDVDGWDAAVKVAIVANVLMGGRLKLEDVARQGIRGVTAERLAAARKRGCCVRLVARAWRDDGVVRASVSPEELQLMPEPDVLTAVGPDGLIGQCVTDSLPPFTVAAHAITPVSTAYDVLADVVTILREGRAIGD